MGLKVGWVGVFSVFCDLGLFCCFDELLVGVLVC